MNQQEGTELLNHHDIRPTANRIVVVKALAQAGRPLSLTELETRIQSIDKSGVFRALTLFRKHHLVHVIEDGSGGVRYELCHSHHDDSDDDLHLHFYCEQCHQTYCLPDTPVPSVTLPAGFCVTSVNYLLKGVCPSCARH